VAVEAKAKFALARWSICSAKLRMSGFGLKLTPSSGMASRYSLV
jgi:hypothetical protein